MKVMKWLAVLLLSYRWDNHALHIYQVLCSSVTIYLKQERRETFPEFFIGRSLVLTTSPIIKYRKKTKKESIIIVNCMWNSKSNHRDSWFAIFNSRELWRMTPLTALLQKRHELPFIHSFILSSTHSTVTAIKLLHLICTLKMPTH